MIGSKEALLSGGDRDPTEHRKPRSGAAFLLAQLGAFAAAEFGNALTALKLIPAHAGIIRILSASPGITQRDLARALSTLPSRIVVYIDELEAKGLVERQPHGTDRRRHALHLTAAGKEMTSAVGQVARKHQASLLHVLSEPEQAQLAALLQRVADDQGLTPHVHPGFARSRLESSDRTD